MRILPLSDLHLEIYPTRKLGIDLAVSRPDVVVLAGDINKSSRAVEWAAETFKDIPVLYVAGNHEYYGSNIDTVPSRIRDACQDTDNVFFLDNGCKIIDGVRFLGATLWTDFCLFGLWRRPMAMMEAKNTMNDYHAIRVANGGYRKLTPGDTGSIHARSRAWMQGELEKPFEGKTVVVTHMAPSKRSISQRYAEDLTSAAYASELDLMASQADLWIHGHTHTHFDYQIEKCRVVTNPLGYTHKGGGNENHEFNPNMIIEI